MKYIDEKFKDAKPEETVALIKRLLSELNITLTEKWNETGIEDCWGVRVVDECKAHGTNGKGVTKDFARASAYAEFMERLCLGKFFYKKQSLTENPEVNLHTFAPDGRYMTKQELIENGEWMDPIIEEYGSGLTREKLANQCVMYAGREPVLTVPYYSLFEDKYVYIPTEFEEHVYSANGCCVGNTRNEAWIHALSEIMERHNCIKLMLSGESIPVISDNQLEKYSIVSRILEKIKKKEDFEVTVFDLSLGTGFPVIATRTIDKKNHSYMVNVGADPVVEIAIQRTLTETFQGQSLNHFSAYCTRMLDNVKEVNAANNVLNQLETGHGLFTCDFFSEELNNTVSNFDFPDNTSKTNKELLEYMLDIFRKLGKPVYVRNASILGFPCYRFIVPGFSESRGLRLTQPIQQYSIGREATKVLKDIRNASDDDLSMLLLYRKMTCDIITRRNNFSHLIGLPLVSCDDGFLLHMHYAYAFYKSNNIKDCIASITRAGMTASKVENYDYSSCASKYMEFSQKGKSKDEIMLILGKFYNEKSISRLKDNLDKSGDVFGDILVKCDMNSCDTCSMKQQCKFNESKRIIAAVGKKYSQFVDGQNKENFKV